MLRPLREPVPRRLVTSSFAMNETQAKSTTASAACSSRVVKPSSSYLLQGATSYASTFGSESRHCWPRPQYHLVCCVAAGLQPCSVVLLLCPSQAERPSTCCPSLYLHPGRLSEIFAHAFTSEFPAALDPAKDLLLSGLYIYLLAICPRPERPGRLARWRVYNGRPRSSQNQSSKNHIWNEHRTIVSRPLVPVFFFEPSTSQTSTLTVLGSSPANY